jgi:hypothetical protein
MMAEGSCFLGDDLAEPLALPDEGDQELLDGDG